MSKKPVVYIASPYTKGDVAVNVRRSFEEWDALWDSGLCIPITPLASHFQHFLTPRSWDDWLNYDLQLIHAACDAVLRLPGESVGADREVEFARANYIPVFFSRTSLIDWLRKEAGK